MSEDLSTRDSTIPRSSPAETSSAGSFEIGEVFAGRYRIEGQIGRGGMGRVFKAQDLVLGETIALKVLPERDPALYHQLVNEVRLALQVTNPFVCRVFDFGQSDGETYLTMEYVDGEDMRSLLRKIGRLSADKTLELARQLCTGLSAAHDQGILHRDLKPANLLISGKGRLQISDFGISTVAETPQFFSAGTPAYMAPEVLRGEPATERSDIYSLGVTLFELATGRGLFRADSIEEAAKLERDPESLKLHQDLTGLSPGLARAVLWCLHPDPAERPPSVRAVAASLPGGDPLRQALDAGETPSPEVVAGASIAKPSLGGVLTLWVALLLTLVALPWLSDLANPSRADWGQKSPAVLANRAAEILDDLGHGELPVADRAWGFRPDFAASGVVDATLFWYRQSPSAMVPWNYSRVHLDDRTSYYDPSPVGADMVQMLLDSSGRLVTLKIVTSAIGLSPEDRHDARAPATPDWPSALAAAGFPPDAAEVVSPAVLPPYFADEQRSWEVQDPRNPNRRLRMEAAALEGKVVFVDVRPTATSRLSNDTLLGGLDSIYFLIFFVLAVVLPVAGTLLARQNLQKRRGDLAGARRLVIFVVVALVCRWLVSADHFSVLDVEVQRINFRLGRVLLEAAMVWVAYIAFEPAIRRFWHEPIISWSRLIHGRFRDPLVGRSVLLGSFVGTAWAILAAVDRILGRSLELTITPDLAIATQLENVVSTPVFLASMIQSALNALYYGIFDLCLLVVLRIATRNPIPAIGIFLLVRGVWETIGGAAPGLSWLTLGVGLAGVAAVVLVRYGLVAYITAFFCYQLLSQMPVTALNGAWFSGKGMTALLLVGLVGSVGFHVALAGRSVASGWLDLPAAQPDPPL